jgi:LDH2 family malate/lactate/ureidoglycolate dehydrogenase
MTTKIKFSITDAEELSKRVLQKTGYTKEESEAITHHLIDSEVRGHPSAGLARILSIRDRLKYNGKPEHNMTVTRESPTSAQLDGKDTLGYLVALKATEMAIEKAKSVGIAVVGADNTWYTGMLSYYAEMATSQDLVVIIASNASPWVAPYGSYEPKFGTNPFCIGFPSARGAPFIWDIGTSNIIHAQAVLASRTGQDLPLDSAFNCNGESTVNPKEALLGALSVWGGHKGSGLAMAVQLLGVLAGSPALTPELADFGYLVIAINPDILRDIDSFKTEVDTFAESIRSSKPLPGQSALRMPFERSNEQRTKTLGEGHMHVEEEVIRALKAAVGEFLQMEVRL